MIKRVLCLMLVPVLALAACGGDDDDGDGGAALPTEGGTEATEDAEVDRDATFRFGYYFNPTRLDPHRATSSFDNTWLTPAYDRLVHQSPEGDPVPGLAESFSFEDDGRTFVLELREGVTFHDGTPFDAEAVRANIERGKTVEGTTVASELEVIESVEVVDDLTVHLNLNGPAASLPLVLSDRPGMMISPTAFENPDLDSAPVGAGMYRLTDFTPADRAVYERFEDYWEPEAAAAAQLEILYLADPQTRLNAVLSGQVDGTHLDPDQRDAAEQGGLTVQVGRELAVVHLQMNRTRSAFGDIRVRQALNHAIDREAIVASLAFGLGEPAVQIFPEGYFAHDPEIGHDSYPYDPDRARELLAEAGVADGLSFEIIVAITPIRVQLAEIIQAQLAEIGVNVSVRQVDTAQVSEIFYSAQQGDTIVAAWGGRPDPLQTAGLLFTPGSLQNPGGHTTEEVQRLYQEALEAVDDDDRTERTQALSAQIVEDALDVPIYFPDAVYVSTEEVVGLQIWIGGKPEFRGVGMRAE